MRAGPLGDDRALATIQRPSLMRRLEPYRTMALSAISELLRSREPHISVYEVVDEYIRRDSKSLRPALLIATCCARGGNAADSLPSAAGVELLHTSFLIHDDIEDGSVRRRGGPSLHAQHGVPLALNAADTLVALTLEALAENRSLDSSSAQAVIGEFNLALRHATEGQALELGWRRENRLDVGVGEYLEMILGKSSWYTVTLPCRVGALISGGQRLRPTSFVKFGWLLGGLFQIGDDIESVLASEQQYGKDWADDVYEGKRTLMLIHLAAVAGAGTRARLHKLFALDRESRTHEDVAWVIEEMHAHGSIAFAQRCARRLADAAWVQYEAEFGSCTPSSHTELIQAVLSYVIVRACPAGLPVRHAFATA